MSWLIVGIRQPYPRLLLCAHARLPLLVKSVNFIVGTGKFLVKQGQALKHCTLVFVCAEFCKLGKWLRNNFVYPGAFRERSVRLERQVINLALDYSVDILDLSCALMMEIGSRCGERV